MFNADVKEEANKHIEKKMVMNDEKNLNIK